jgi:hypothetical protein
MLPEVPGGVVDAIARPLAKPLAEPLSGPVAANDRET